MLRGGQRGPIRLSSSPDCAEFMPTILGDAVPVQQQQRGLVRRLRGLLQAWSAASCGRMHRLLVDRRRSTSPSAQAHIVGGAAAVDRGDDDAVDFLAEMQLAPQIIGQRGEMHAQRRSLLRRLLLTGCPPIRRGDLGVVGQLAERRLQLLVYARRARPSRSLSLPGSGRRDQPRQVVQLGRSRCR